MLSTCIPCPVSLILLLSLTIACWQHQYFLSGIKLLPHGCWESGESEYEFAIEIHNAAQNALFATGDFRTLTLLGTKVISNAKKFDDKLISYKNVVRYLVSLNRLDEAISTSKVIMNVACCSDLHSFYQLIASDPISGHRTVRLERTGRGTAFHVRRLCSDA